MVAYSGVLNGVESMLCGLGKSMLTLKLCGFIRVVVS